MATRGNQFAPRRIKIGQLNPAMVNAIDARFEKFWDLACDRDGVAGLDAVLVDLCRDSYPGREVGRAMQ